MKTIIFTILSALTIGQQAFALTDIMCDVSKLDSQSNFQTIATKMPIQDNRDTWTKITDNLAIRCFSGLNNGLNALGCHIGISNTTSSSKPLFIGGASYSAISLDLMDYKITCSSYTQFNQLAKKFQIKENKKNNHPSRSLTSEELNFCKNFRSDLSTIFGDDRLLCVQTLQKLQTPLTDDQLNFCSTFEKEAGSISIDERLPCVLQISGEI